MTQHNAKLIRRSLAAFALVAVASLVTIAYATAPSASTSRTFTAPQRAVANTPQEPVRLAEAKKSAPNAAPAASSSEPVTLTRGGKTITGVVNLNTATASELQRLPGVGAAKADRILEWRKQNGPFKRIVDLRRVKGFGAKSVDKLKPHLVLSGPTTLSMK